MQLEAIYDHGRVTFVSPVRLAQDTFRVLVTVPDQQLLPAEPPSVNNGEPPVWVLGPFAQGSQARLDAVRCSPLSEQAADDSAESARADRLDAFLLRGEG